MNRTNLTIYGLIAAIVLSGIGFGIAQYLKTAELTASIVTLVTPTEGATVEINGVDIPLGEVALKPGGYKIEVSADGFTPQTHSVSLEAGDVARLAVALEPESPEKSDYYRESASDARKAEAIAGQLSEARADAKIEQLPIIRQLPKIDQNNYRVDYGLSVEHPDDPDAVALIITHYSEPGKQSAINWLKYRGYTQSNTEIIIKNGDAP